jgi:hypothetical protein
MRISLIVLAMLLALAPSARSQSLSVKGAIISLGESEAQVQTDIAAVGLEFSRFNESIVGLTGKSGDMPHELFGEVEFKGGKVSFVDRQWIINSTPNDTETTLTIFNSAISSVIESDSQARCTVSVKSRDDSPSSGLTKTSRIECIRSDYTHSLETSVTDCSAGCSIGSIAPGLIESLKRNN